ncbi:hypothetical protein EDB80DRAFT_586089 [Ilyonectria destructans]|nr:hypothetical protein EDB80DRAFT_586089 [Ilyonectria destructans]
MSQFIKEIPKSILIFGAAGHIGGPLTTYLAREAPTIKLRLATSSSGKKDALQSQYRNAEVVSANYNDIDSLKAAVEGIEAVFVITPNGFREAQGMENLVAALKDQKQLIQVIRFLGIFPELNPAMIPPVLAKKTLIWPEHRVPFLDPRDIAEVAGKLFLSDNAKHIGVLHTMNNGHDWLTFKEVSKIVGEVLGQEIAYDGSFEAFSGFYGPIIGEMVPVLWRFFKFEESHEECWALNTFVERTLGRKPTTVREWLIEHKDALLNGKPPRK